jgi:hypothetical protein
MSASELSVRLDSDRAPLSSRRGRWRRSGRRRQGAVNDAHAKPAKPIRVGDNPPPPGVLQYQLIVRGCPSGAGPHQKRLQLYEEGCRRSGRARPSRRSTSCFRLPVRGGAAYQNGGGISSAGKRASRAAWKRHPRGALAAGECRLAESYWLSAAERLHLDEVGLRCLHLGQEHRQHAVVVGRIDLVGCDPSPAT